MSWLWIPLLLPAGAVGEQDRLDGLGCGASDDLSKPIRLADRLVRLRARPPASHAAAAAALATTAQDLGAARSWRSPSATADQSVRPCLP
ncbi:hypothetical protein ACLF3G_21920 [Falsiroseomonas sp. HC035]|uniref:hypothetical protein n=1 Tax=Falsiroseomonas sp. HC035 TaxID=3390999 RepID=UPI003D31DC58